MAHRKWGGEDGQAVLEFALVLPILVLFLLGIIDFARIAAVQLALSNATRDAARYASVGASDAEIGQVVQTDASGLGNSLQWTVTPQSVRISGQPVTVSADETVTMIDPLMAAILGSSVTVRSAVAMRVE